MKVDTNELRGYVDIVGLALSDDCLLLAECKWTDAPVGHDFVIALREKADRVRWGPDTRDEQFALFSKSGFVDGLAAELGDEWTLFSLTKLDRLLSTQV